MSLYAHLDAALYRCCKSYEATEHRWPSRTGYFWSGGPDRNGTGPISRPTLHIDVAGMRSLARNSRYLAAGGIASDCLHPGAIWPGLRPHKRQQTTQRRAATRTRRKSTIDIHQGFLCSPRSYIRRRCDDGQQALFIACSLCCWYCFLDWGPYDEILSLDEMEYWEDVALIFGFCDDFFLSSFCIGRHLISCWVAVRSTQFDAGPLTLDHWAQPCTDCQDDGIGYDGFSDEDDGSGGSDRSSQDSGAAVS